MVHTLAQLIAQYGYVAIVLGCFVEGETAILLGIVAASHAILSVPGVIGAAIVGTIMGDNLWFHIGRRTGRPALARRPDWQQRAQRVEALLERYGAPLMIGFRFLYGLRYITPFVLGSLNISPWRFLVLESIGTLIWANTVALLGIVLAGALRRALDHIENLEQALVIAVLAIALGGYAVYRWRWRRR